MMTEQTEITPEQIAAWQRQQAQQAQQRKQDCIRALVALAEQQGFAVVAYPQYTPDGRTVAVWGVQPL